MYIEQEGQDKGNRCNGLKGGKAKTRAIKAIALWGRETKSNSQDKDKQMNGLKDSEQEGQYKGNRSNGIRVRAKTTALEAMIL